MSIVRKDEYKKVQIPFGFNEKGEPVTMPLFHTFWVAMTGHGKTLGMKSILLKFHKLHPEWKILIIDSKDKRDYADLYSDIPLSFVDTTDPIELKNLLEPLVNAKLMYYFDKIIEEAVYDTLGEIYRSIHKKVEDTDTHRIKMNGKDLSKLRVLSHLMGKLVDLIEKPNIKRTLELHDGFNVMPVNLPEVQNPNLKRAFQQLIVRSTILLLLADPQLERTLLVLDESHKWSAQRETSICKQPISNFVSEGRSQDKLLYLSDQALTKVDKEPLKNIKVWIVGQQMESNEVDDAKATVNSMTDLTIQDSDIKKLKMGNFIIVNGLQSRVDRAYLQPYGVPDHLAKRIAKGADPELAEPYIRIFESELNKKGKGDVEEEMYKELFEKEKQRTKNLEGELKKAQEVITAQGKLERPQEEIDLLHQKLEAAEKKYKQLSEEDAKITDALEATHQERKEMKVFREALTKFLFPNGLPTQAQTTEENAKQPIALRVESQVTNIKVEPQTVREIVLPADKPTGKIMNFAVKLSKTQQVFKGIEVRQLAAENAVVFNNIEFNKGFAYLVSQGYLIKEGEGYRLPKFASIT